MCPAMLAAVTQRCIHLYLVLVVSFSFHVIVLFIFCNCAVHLILWGSNGDFKSEQTQQYLQKFKCKNEDDNNNDKNDNDNKNDNILAPPLRVQFSCSPIGKTPFI